MKNLIAKPIIKDQYWVVTDGEKKVGNLIANNVGVELKLYGNSSQYDSLISIEKDVHIAFDNNISNTPTQIRPFTEYPTPDKIYNSVMEIKKKLHLFTTSPKSKCYHAAGWFLFENEELGLQFCPKYIFIQRYNYVGPFKTKTDALSADK
jgi:hypothetical protein